MPIKISYFLDNEFNIYQIPSNIENFFLERNFKKIDDKDLKNLKKKNQFFELRKKFLF